MPECNTRPLAYASRGTRNRQPALSEGLLSALDRKSETPHNRSAVVEVALRTYLAQLRQGEDSGDLAVITAHASELNEEADDVLAYQVIS